MLREGGVRGCCEREGAGEMASFVVRKRGER
jgi:hypothetical protein